MSHIPAVAPREHGRFPYSAIVDRPPLRWPDGARVAVWVIPNVEHFLFDRPGAAIVPATTGFLPDVLNYSWRDYGPRVGIWRLMEILEKHGIRGTAALNADAARLYPRIVEAGSALGWEWMGHGVNNNTMHDGQSGEEERRLVKSVLETIEESAGVRPRGWLSPGLSETHRTLDLLAESGIDYVANWVNDDQPYPMRVEGGSILSLPYSAEINDYAAFIERGQSGEEFARTIRDQFDVLYEDGRATGRVMAIALHPFLIGHPHRAKHLDRALAHIVSHRDVWFATGSEIADWYAKVASEG